MLPLTTERYNTLVARFIAYASLKNNGGFLKPSRITQFISALFYVIRSRVFQHCLHQDSTSLCELVKMNQNTPYGVLRTYKALFDTLSLNESNFAYPIYWETNSNGTIDFSALWIGNYLLRLSQFQFGYRDYLSKLSTLINSLLVGFTHKIDFQSIKDDIGNADELYSCLCPKVNPQLFLHRRRFAEHLTLILSTDRERHAWCLEFEKIVELFIPLIFLSSGQPARVTEFCKTQLLFNQKKGKKRNVYWFRGRLMLAQDYHKFTTENDKLILRFLPENLSRLGMIYIVLLQPICFALTQKAPQNILYETPSRDLNPDKIRLFLKKGFTDMFKVPDLKPSDFRQMTALIVHCHFKAEIKEDRSVFHRQAGHSELTAQRLYGQSMQLHFGQGTTVGMIDDFWTASNDWQSFFGFESFSNPIVSRNEIKTDNLQIENHPYFQNIQNKKAIDYDNNDLIISLSALQKIYGPEARFKSAHQANALKVMLEKKHSLIVLSTGSGKSSLLFTLPFIEPTKLSIVITPFISLENDLIKRCQVAKVPFVMWDRSLNLCDLIGHLIIINVSIFSSQFMKMAFKKELRQNGHLVARVVIDEAHELLQGRYREEIINLPYLIIGSVNSP
jgi:hypothetical protein